MTDGAVLKAAVPAMIVATVAIIVLVAEDIAARGEATAMCGPPATIAATLARDFGEAPVFRGRHPTAPVTMTVYLNALTGSWSVVQSDGASACLTASGRDGVTQEPGDPT